MKEYGRIGQKRWEGQFYEEFLPELSGMRGIKVFQEMKENDDTVGAILFAIKMLIRQVEWHVEPGGDSAKDKETNLMDQRWIQKRIKMLRKPRKG